MTDAKPGILIAIDGPAGSGKSTVTKLVADGLGIAFLDTGAMYRALTLTGLEQGLDLTDVQQLLEAADRMNLELRGTAKEPQILLDGRDVTQEIRSELVARHVSTVAGLLPIRAWMAREQRRQMLDARKSGRGMAAEGRDTTTVVCPDADVRVLLLADPAARLRRRALEMFGNVTEETLARVRPLVEKRDQTDSQVSEFMEPAEGVTVIDSSDLTVDQVVTKVVKMALGPDGKAG